MGSVSHRLRNFFVRYAAMSIAPLVIGKFLFMGAELSARGDHGLGDLVLAGSTNHLQGL